MSGLEVGAVQSLQENLVREARNLINSTGAAGTRESLFLRYGSTADSRGAHDFKNTFGRKADGLYLYWVIVKSQIVPTLLELTPLMNSAEARKNWSGTLAYIVSLHNHL